MRVTCLGATRTVTGSCFLCRQGRSAFLVDCGMFQGGREADRKNRRRFAFDPRALDAVVLTHAHIDHSGLLPKLVREGFGGRIYATPATADLCGIMLPDSAHIQEMEAEWQTRKNVRRGWKPVEPLYGQADAEAALTRLERVAYGEPVRISEEVGFAFHDAGHILGSAFVEIRFASAAGEKTLVFSGDLGQPGQFIIRDSAPPGRADFVFMESTYGNRLHRSMDETLDELARILVEAHRDRARVIIPAFAVERTQEVLFALHRLQAEGRAPEIPVYVDSPLAISATLLFRRHPECFDRETLKILEQGENPLDMPSLHFSRTAEDSRALNELPGPLIIISASGMCNAGRIKHHLKHNLWRPENHVVIVGYQAQGTTGRELVDGARKVKIFREDVQVRAAVHTLGGFSAHADRKALEAWLAGLEAAPEQVFLIHGEVSASMDLAGRLQERLACPVTVPEPGQELSLAEAAETVEAPEVLPPQGRQIRDGVADLVRQVQSLSDRIAERDWDREEPPLRHQVLKQMRKVRRLAEKIEKMVA